MEPLLPEEPPMEPLLPEEPPMELPPEDPLLPVAPAALPTVVSPLEACPDWNSC